MFRLSIFPLLCLFAATLLSACGTAPTPPASRAVSQNDFECIREAIYFEASASNPQGQHAVADVITNRARDPRFPNSICAVISDGQARGACQFSYRCDNISEEFHDAVKFENATRIAKEALQNPEEDITNGALFFHAARMAPGWFATLIRTGNFGGNIFYRPRGRA